MRLNGEQVERMRQNAFFLLDSILPYRPGDGKFAEVCKDYGGHGTTCGFLPHWLMWRLGVTNADRVNRAEPGFRYRTGKNIGCIRYSEGDWRWKDTSATPLYVDAYRTPAMSQGGRPGPGDVVHIMEMPGENYLSEHVFCVLRDPVQGEAWWTAESGQDHGTWGRVRHDRELEFAGSTNPLLTGNSPKRSVLGWLALDRLDYGPPPRALPFPFL